MRLLLALFFGLLSVSTARAWDDGGHEIVDAIAYAHLNAKAKQAVDQLAAQLHGPRGTYDPITLGCWMDDIRSAPTTPDDRKFRTWHYIDIPVDPRDPMPSFEPGADTPEHGNAVQALKRALSVLQGGSDPYITDQATALAMIEHLIGDVHQPLHCATKYFLAHGEKHDDHGGNLEFVLNGPPGDDKFNLHRFWDEAYRASFDNATGTVVIENFPLDPAAVRDIAAQINALPAAPDHTNFTGFDDWARESNTIARDFVYPGISATSNAKFCRLSSAYVVKGQIIARAQLLRAGLRLARLLNDTLGGAMPPPYTIPPNGQSDHGDVL